MKGKSKEKFKRIIKQAMLLAAACILAGGSFAASLMFFLYSYGRNDTVDFTEDAAIVLGAAVWGEQVSALLANRLRRAVYFHEQNPYAYIVVSGGQGEGDITEAEAMRRFLTERGVPDELIIKEDRSTNTYENIKFSKQLLDELFEHEYRVVIITNDFHIYRSVAMARRQGMEATHLNAPIRRQYMPWNFTRESAGVLRLWLMGR